MSVAAQRTRAPSQVSARSEPKPGARKIVHLTSVHPAFDVRIFHKECKSIARAGYDVTLIAAHDRDETVDGVRMKAMVRASGRISRMLRTTWAICRQAIREDADLYHFHDPELIPVALVMRIRGKKVIYDVHEDVPADILSKQYIPSHFRRPIAWLAGLIEKKSSRYFSGVVAATSPISRRFRFRTAGTVVVSNYPVLDQEPDPRAQSWSRPSGSAVVYAGLLSQDRCIREIVEAMDLLSPDLAATLNLAGSFSPPASRSRSDGSEGMAEGQLSGCRCEPFRSLTPAEWRARGTLHLSPGSIRTVSKRLPTSFLSTCTPGFQVIASDFPGFHAVVNSVRCGLLVDPLDSKSIARAIEYVLTHSRRSRTNGSAGTRGRQPNIQLGKRRRQVARALYATLLDSTSTA